MPRGSDKKPIETGDSVLIKNDSTNRVFWKMGKVEELIPGEDGKVRAAVVKVGSSMKQPTLLRRPLQLLIPIEVKVPACVQPEER